ncbi:hypothetical protein [Wolbachia endosymbiont (group E) of Neria commutata]|uniref:hypothetical protein n=1 Tax=Wolbachia endosymbiont (group E) of Neria commutata TaxID=3066149 RepID=UPI003132B5FC
MDTTIAGLVAGFISPLLLIFGAVNLANFLILPLAMLITNFVAWAAIGVIFIVVSAVVMSIAKPLFHLAKDFINERRAQKKENGEEKVTELKGLQEKIPENQARSVVPDRSKTPDRDSGTVTPETAIAKDSFVDKTNNGDYNCWLSHSDIANIARVHYGWKAHLDRKGLRNPHKSVIFTCLGEIETLKCELEEYKVKVERDSNLLFASVLNINGNHWVTLVVAYNPKDKQFRAYYCDPFGNGLPKLSHIDQQKKDRTSVLKDPSALKEFQEYMSFSSNLFDENLIWQREKEEHVKERLDYVRKQIDKLISKGISNKILQEWIDSLSKLIDDLIQQRKDGVTEDLDSIKNRVHALSKKNNVISLDKDYVTYLLQQILEISDDNIRSSKAEQQKDTWNCGIFAPKNAKIITDALKAGESFDEIDAKLKYTLSPKQLIEKRKEFAEALKKGEQSIASVPNKRNRRSSGNSSASSVSLDSGISVGSKEGKQTQKTEVKAYDTVGDGNCFFHSVFGKKDYTYMPEVYKDGVYRDERAQEMREEWHKFLSQFTSLNDPRMPKALKEQLQKVFGAFLEKPGDLTGRSDMIEGLVEQTKKKIENVENNVKTLVSKIVNDFSIPQNEAISNLKRYVQLLCSEFTEEEYNEKYNSDTMTNSFLNDEVLYKSYLEAISKQNYYVFAEEIPILASLAGIKITVHHKDNGNNVHEVFKPNPEMMKMNMFDEVDEVHTEVYKRNGELWGDKKQETIYLKPGHYERAEVVPLTPPPSRTESVSSLKSVVSYCPIM